MLISLNWLKDYIDIDVSVDELAEQLTMLGLEIEAVERPGDEISDVYVGKILSIEPHPDADKLVVCRTDVGQAEPAQIVCGAKNMSVGDKVPTAVVGASLPGGFKIARRKMRGVESQGMMCSPRELGLGEDHAGLMILDPDLPIGEDVRPLIGLDDVVMEIEITPNRGDWACMIGVARELAARYGTAYRTPEVTLNETAPLASELASVTIEDAELCPRYIGRVLTDVQVGPSPQWLCQRLIAAGQRPINNIVDITNCVLLETGHPLHAFDLDKLAENRVVVRRARVGETMNTLDGEKRVLSEDMLVIADAKDAQAVAGVMGGADSEVGEGTTRVLLESAYFKPASVRATARALGMSTEASQHFQRGADPEMARYAIDRCAGLFQELAGATLAEGALDEYPAPAETKHVSLRYARADQLLGTSVPGSEQREYLERLGFPIKQDDAQGCTVAVPPWRHDVSIEADLIEEVARLHGFGNIPIALPKVGKNEMVFAPLEARMRRLRNHLVGLGLTEMFSWTFSCATDIEKAGLGGDYLDLVALENPLSERHTAMRSSLIPGMLANTAFNLNHGTLDIAAFEMGPVYRPRPNEDLAEEPVYLSIVLSGTVGERHWSRTAQAADFYDLKGCLEDTLAHCRCEADLVEADFGTLQKGAGAAIQLGKTTLGHLGKVKHRILRAYDIEQEVYVLELDVTALLKEDASPTPFEEVPSFPPSLRDMAVVVDAGVPAGELVATAQQAGGRLLKSVEIFDIYDGEQVPAGKKSVALNLVFQSSEQTLTDKKTQKSIDKILKQLQNKHGAALR